jgi:prepilin-type N-terminal cleavage/methylation domain-containing protein
MSVPRGFTLIEVVIAVLVGSILTGIALTGYGNAKSRFAVRGARNTFVAVHARARAAAIEGGTTARLHVFPGGDSVTVVRGGVTLESINFRDVFGVDVQASGNLRLCMSPRGFADTACNSFSSAEALGFRAGPDEAGVQILPLGQLVY